jgi:hypothetical protein
MEQPPYSLLAQLYAHLMRKIDYKDWSEYLLAIFRNFAVSDDIILEIGGGNGAIASYLHKYFPNIILTDLSKEMLFKCIDTALVKVCCNMKQLPFKNKFDLIYSTFDTVNYLINEKELKMFFSEINSLSNENTVCTFDVSLEKNSIKYEKYLNRKGVFKGMSYIQKSKYDILNKIHYNYFDITLEDGKIVSEIHAQKIFDFETYFNILDESGLFVVDCFDAFSFNKVSEKSLRAQFVIKKKR